MAKPARASRLRERLREHTQIAILAAAEEVLATQGLEARIDAIATHAGVAVGTLYNHFGDRDGIVSAVLQHNQDELHAALDTVLAAPMPEFTADLKRFVSTLLDHFQRHGAFMTALMQQRMRDKDFLTKRKEFLKPLRDRVQSLIARGVRDGHVRSGDDERTAQFLLGLVHQEFVHAVCDGPRSPDPAAVAVFFLHGAAPIR